MPTYTGDVSIRSSSYPARPCTIRPLGATQLFGLSFRGVAPSLPTAFMAQGETGYHAHYQDTRGTQGDEASAIRKGVKSEQQGARIIQRINKSGYQGEITRPSPKDSE